MKVRKALAEEPARPSPPHVSGDDPLVRIHELAVETGIKDLATPRPLPLRAPSQVSAAALKVFVDTSAWLALALWAGPRGSGGKELGREGRLKRAES